MHETRDSVADVWGPRTPSAGMWPVRSDERLLEEPDEWVQSVCVLCSTGCGMDVAVKDGRMVGVRGRPGDHVNHGRLGPKGLHGWQANASADRLTTPLIRRGRELVPASWDEAMGMIVERSKGAKEEYGQGSIGFYNSGQLFLEEYYTLAVVAEAGIGTSHVDGNTRLCTATASIALIESFGTDGQPGTFDDFDVTDAVFLVGHNMAATQTVLWSRVLDQLAGPNPPRLVVVDPRLTATARRADVHLTPRPGTNLPLLNGLLRIVIERGWIDSAFIAAHTINFEHLVTTTDPWTPERVEAVTRVPVKSLEAAAEIVGTSPTLVSTCLQGVYQSLQATASAVQVNNLHLIRGMIGKPGCTVFQMNGQPTAQNTRECGADGEFVAFRNWNNATHVADTARVWNVEPKTLPTWTPPTHAMQIFRYCETGAIRMLWIIGTNPAVSLPDLKRIHKILERRDLFVVVSDAYLTETAARADVVLPAALWGEKTGTTTNADRTVHLSMKAMQPPGQARSDLDTLLDYAKRMDFRNKDGGPLVTWTDAEGAFESWKACSKGRPCDYSGMSYALLAERGAIQWPCNETYPEGRARLYEDGQFNTATDYCETYGHDVVTGGALKPEEHAAMNPAGRAIIKGAEQVPPPEEPDDDYPYLLTTGRVTYHFHTRTKTGRVKALNAAAPEPFVELAPTDAAELGVSEGDLVEITSRRASIRVPARVSGIEPGVVFVPFHYGDWDDPSRDAAANELTISGWDPVSKQPFFKFAAVRLQRVRSASDRDDAGPPARAAAEYGGTTARPTVGAGSRAGAEGER
ncbi:MAG: molybdopterin oxidoreductase family protein [Chloroflexota bacterium]